MQSQTERINGTASRIFIETAASRIPSDSVLGKASVVFGTAHIGLPEEERMHALHLLIDKLSPEYKELGDKYAHASFYRTEIIRIDLTEYSGKCKRMSK